MITKKHYLAGFFASIAVVAGLLPLLAYPQKLQATSSAQLSLSPASQAVTVGSNVVVTVVENSGSDAVNAVQANLSYSTAQFNSVSITSTSAFNIDAQDTASGGTIQIARGTTTPVTGSQSVAVITLHSSGTGSSGLNFTAGSAVARSSDNSNILTSSTGGTYTVNAVPTPPPPPPAPAPSPSPTPTPTPATTGKTSTSSSSSGSKSTTSPSPSPSSTPTPSPSPSSSASSAPQSTSSAPGAPTISSVQVSDVSDNGATVTWQTDQPATSVVEYGLDAKYGLTAVADGLATSHTVMLTAPYITKGATYYIQVMSTNAAGATATGGAQQFTTAGFTITMQIVDKNGKPIAGAQITLGDQTKTTNSSGDVTFDNVPAGTQKVKVKSGGTVSTQNIAVGQHDPTTGAYKPQTFLVKANRGISWWPYVLVALIALLATAFTLHPPTFTNFGKLSGYVRKLMGGKSTPVEPPSASASEVMAAPGHNGIPIATNPVSQPSTPTTPEVLPGTFVAPPVADPDPEPAAPKPEPQASADDSKPTPTIDELPDTGASPTPGAVFHPPSSADADS